MKMTEEKVNLQKVPRHIAFIMDGNGRWARQRNKPRLEGHRAGTQNIRRILEKCAEYDIEVVTIWAFSTENWTRPPDEIRGLMTILREMLKREVKNLHKNGVRLQHVGRLEGLEDDLKGKIHDALELTKNNTRITLNVAFNYGGRAEIVDAVKRIIADGVTTNAVTEDLIEQYLYTAGQPDPDLIVRTGGEMRLSGFLMWQSAYAEYYTTPTYWPDFDEGELYKALVAYGNRERRFGGLESQ